MVKTQSQTEKLALKKDKEEYCKPTLLLNRFGNTRNNRSNNITKRKPFKNNNNILPTQEIKEEEDTDTKSLLQPPPKHPKLLKGQCVSQEQINQLTDVIVSDRLSVYKAARTVKISYMTAVYYYNQYKNHPEKKIPSPRNQLMHLPIFPTQQHITNIIRYIKDDKINIKEASQKADMSYRSGRYYFHRYLEDPDHKIPILPSRQNYTQDRKNEFISYIDNDKMTVSATSRKANMHRVTAGIYS